MEKKYDFENSYGVKWYCTIKQWKYWNRKEIAEHKNKMDKWYDAMFPETNTNGLPCGLDSIKDVCILDSIKYITI